MNQSPKGAFIYKRALLSSRRVLHCDSLPLSRLAEKFGTPLYVYSATAIGQRFRAFDHAFRSFRHTTCYSVKANSNLGILRLLGDLGCGFDVVSGGELDRVLCAHKRSAARVVFSGVGKTLQEMDAALRAGILIFNVESESELALLAARAHGMKKIARVALRVNPDVPAETHPYISTGLRQHKFGVPLEAARAFYATGKKQKSLDLAGVSVHIGSQIIAVAPFAAAMERVAELVCELRGDGHRIRYVDAGGGLGIPYEPDHPLDFSKSVTAYAKAVMRPLKSLRLHLLLEPGRALVGPAGSLLTRVLYRKQNGNKHFLVVDAAMNDLLRPSLYGAYHQIVPVEINQKEKLIPEVVDIVGPVCETGDFFARDRELPAVAEGALLAILDTGAYGMSLASNYNSRPRPAEVLVNGKSTKLIRRRESVADLFCHEG